MLCENQLGEILANIADECEIKFNLSGTVMDANEVFQSNGLLPIFCRNAEILSINATGRSLGFEWQKDETSLCGLKIKLNDKSSSSERIAYLLESVMSEVKESNINKTVNLDSMFGVLNLNEKVSA